MTDNSRYPAILFISKVIRFFAWCFLILTVSGMVFVLSFGFRDGFSTIIAFLGIGISGGFFTLALFAIAESLIVMIDIEFNTRTTASLIDKVRSFEKTNKEIRHTINSNEKSSEEIKSSKIKINSISEAIKKLKQGGIDVQIVEAGATDNKYLIVKGTTTRYIYKDAELIELANEI